MIQGNYFITPHAVESFQQRIDDLPYEAARTRIIEMLSKARSAKHDKHGRGLILRVREKGCNFRAIVKGNTVVTILRSGY